MIRSSLISPAETGIAMFSRICLLLTGLVLLAGIAGVLAGTASADEEPGRPFAPRSTARARHEDTGAESWYSIEYEGQAAGYELVRTLRIKAEDKGHPSVTTQFQRTRQTRLNLQRSGTAVSLSATLETLETANGQLESWELSRTGADGSFIGRRGVWDHQRRAMQVFDTSDSAAPPVLIPMAAQPYSPIFTEWPGSLVLEGNRPWKGGVFFPESSISADVEVQRLGKSSLQRPDGSRPSAVRLSWQPVSAPDLKTRLYLDAENGDCLLVEQPLLGGTLRLIRSTPEAALGLAERESLDLQLQALLPVRGRLPEAISERGVRLEVLWKTPSIVSLPDAEFQTVESRERGRVVLICRPARRPAVVEKKQLRNHELYLGASRWIDFEADPVRRLQALAGGGTETSANAGHRLTAFVHKRMQFSAFTTQLQPASRVAARLQGDCTEQTLLLCALLRGRGIPARAAAGFVYVPQLNAFAPHLWTEAWLEGMWFPLDSTMPPEVPQPLLLKVTDSPLNNDLSGSVSLFAPLLSLCGQAEVVLSDLQPGGDSDK